MLELGRTESVDIDVRILFADVMQKVDVPFERQFRMMPALHQNLYSARGGKFVQFLIDLIKAQDVMVLIFLGPIKRSEFAIDVADVRVVNVAIHDISHDLAPAPAVTFRLCQIAPGMGKRAQFFQRPPI